MTITWNRNHSMDFPIENPHKEIWSVSNLLNKFNEYVMRVYLGKPIDILSLKRNILEDYAIQVSHIKNSRESVYKSNELESIQNCPICNASIEDSIFLLNVYGGIYHQCLNCNHCYIINRATEKKMREFYSTDTNYASTYIDKERIEMRLQEVTIPKVKWAIEQFTSLYGKEPKSILDVGAGGGHFVESCKQLGLDSYGIEISEPDRDFCKTVFDIELESTNFEEEWNKYSNFDIITFWSVLEHIPNPINFLKAAYKALSNRETMVIVEVPRWNSFSVAIQKLFPSTIIRHLDSVPHIHLYTDSSLSTAFISTGFSPYAAWYIGMDIYELITQFAYSSKNNQFINDFGKYIPDLQNAIDRNHLSDEIILAGKPQK